MDQEQRAPVASPQPRPRPRPRPAAVALVAALLVAAGCGSSNSSSTTSTTSATTSPSPPCGTKRTATYATHSGFDPKLSSLDVYLPAADEHGCRDRALVVWVHGGGWTGGDKSEFMTDKVRLFNDAGYVFASVNYRLTDPEKVPPAPRYPVHDQDVADAVAWLISHASELGVDTSRIALLGHSAGGGIVAAITTDDRYLGTHNLKLGAVRCAASMDGEGYDVTVGATHPDPVVQKVYRDAFGDDPATWATASPMNHVTAGKSIPDFFIAARGPEVRLDLHVEFATALRDAGVPVTVLDARELEHADLTTIIGAPGDTVVTPALMTFLGGCFAAAHPG
jgi:arylformamidase